MKTHSFITPPTQFIVILIIILITIPTMAAGKVKWKITSLEWPPISSQRLPLGGMSIVVLREALKTESIELIVEYYPWTRSIEKARDPSYLGYYPAWPEEVTEGFKKSSALFTSPAGFVEPVERPLVWNKLSYLKGKNIGTVQSYGNTAEFNRLVRDGVILTELTMDDLSNIKKVAAGRIDGAFIDLNNLDYFLKNDLKELTGIVRPNKKIIDNKDIVIAINNKFSNKKAAEIITRSLKRINADKIILDYKKKYLK